jgi:hypothetical protein
MTFPEIVKAIAAELTKLTDQPYVVVPQDAEDTTYRSIYVCVNADQAKRLVFYNPQRYASGGKIGVSGCPLRNKERKEFPNSYTHPYPSDISVSPDRPPATLAKDIHKRLLVKLIETWDEGEVQLAAYEAREAARCVIRDKLKAMGAFNIGNPDSFALELVLGNTNETPSGHNRTIDLEVNSESSITIKFPNTSMPTGVAFAILEAITAKYPPPFCKACGKPLRCVGECSNQRCAYSSLKQSYEIRQVNANTVEVGDILIVDDEPRHVSNVESKGRRTTITLFKTYHEDKAPIHVFANQEMVRVTKL